MDNRLLISNIKNVIHTKGYLQRAVAERAGLNPTTFSNMLNGRASIKAIDVLNIANALGVTPNDLFGTDAS